jgi:threonine/homoserine/homoserine lactone efflux protein
MPKALCIAGSIVAVLLLLIFGLDLAVGFPFRRISMAMDIGSWLGAALLAYMSWTTFKEQK